MRHNERTLCNKQCDQRTFWMNDPVPCTAEALHFITRILSCPQEANHSFVMQSRETGSFPNDSMQGLYQADPFYLR